jgi:uncharacterized protein
MIPVFLALLQSCEGFAWDAGNTEKNWEKHRVSTLEIEQVFFDPKLAIVTDRIHSVSEERFIALGKTKAGRLLFVVFTIRDKKIRVISARDASKRKEQLLYEEAT